MKQVYGQISLFALVNFFLFSPFFSVRSRTRLYVDQPVKQSRLESGITLSTLQSSSEIPGDGSEERPYTSIYRAFIEALKQIEAGDTDLILCDKQNNRIYEKSEIKSVVEKTQASTWKGILGFTACTQGRFLERIEQISEALKGAPYISVVDRFVDWSKQEDRPKGIRCDAVDSLSYIELVCALALTRSNDHSLMYYMHLFNTHLQRLMFAPDMEPSIMTRHRFFDAEWLPANQFIAHDITEKVCSQTDWTGKQLTKGQLLKKEVEKRAATITNPEERAQFLEKHMRGLDQMGILCSLPRYIPCDHFLKEYQSYQAAVTAPLILSILENRSYLREEKGSHYTTMHVGFLLKTEDGLIFRHADKERSGTVVDVDLRHYLQEKKAAEGVRFRGIAIAALRDLD